VTLIQVFAGAAGGLDVRAYGPPAPSTAVQDAEDLAPIGGDAGDGAPPRPPAAAIAAPIAVAPPPVLEGVGHALHEVRTHVATRALIRALADDPAAALTAVIARLFSVVVLHQGRGRGGGALTLEAEAYGRVRTSPIEALDGDVRRRLAERRAASQAAGLTPIAWVAALPQEEKMALLAELAALSLDLREERTTSVRSAARAEAAEIAALCQAEVTRHWTPDAAFLGAHSKPMLLGMLEAMGAGETGAGACRKDELVSRVAERAAERRWAPAYLSWTAEPKPDETADPRSA
jgi:ParB family chromosome partitioning protein